MAKDMHVASKEKWLTRGPELNELVSEIKDDRKGKNRTAIVIPTFRSEKIIAKHLEYLSKQTTREFDAIVVYGPEDNFVDSLGISVSHIRTSEDIGSAGSFYAGEKYAMDEKYDYIVLTDADCYPVDSELLSSLIKTQEASDKEVVVIPTTIVPSSEFIGQMLPYYGCVRAETLRKVGLSWLPYFYVGEETEMEHRLRKIPKIYIKQNAKHDTRPLYFFTPKNYYVLKNMLTFEFMVDSYWRFFRYFATYIFMALAFLVIDPKYSIIYRKPVMGFLGKKLFRADLSFFPRISVPEKLPLDAVDLSGGDPRKFFIKVMHSIPTMLNKTIISDRAGITGITTLVLYLLSRDFYVVHRSQGSILFHGKAPIARKLAFVILSPFIAASSAFLSVMGFAYAKLTIPYHTSKNLKYGLEDG